MISLILKSNLNSQSVLKDEVEYSNAAWLLRYQMESLLDVYKRLM